MPDLKAMRDRIRASHEKRQAYEEDIARKSDIRLVRQQIQQQGKREESKELREQGKKALKWVVHGFGNIANSLNNPSDSRRMRISQMPGKRSDIDIVRNATPGKLKDPAMENMDIRGKLINRIKTRGKARRNK
jgi:hypothetical protein